MSWVIRQSLLALSSLFLAAGSASAAVVVTIDISNPAAVVITTTSANSAINGTQPVNFSAGISFLNFFTQNESMLAENPISGNWTAAGTGTSYNRMVTFVYEDPDIAPGVDLSIYNLQAALSNNQVFSTSQAAFTGSSVVDLSAFTHLPAVGTVGSVNLGFKSSQGGTIGQWQVVPEPASCGLAVLGAMAAFLRRRR